jgi:hypothetical protein
VAEADPGGVLGDLFFDRAAQVQLDHLMGRVVGVKINRFALWTVKPGCIKSTDDFSTCAWFQNLGRRLGGGASAGMTDFFNNQGSRALVAESEDVTYLGSGKDLAEIEFGFGDDDNRAFGMGELSDGQEQKERKKTKQHPGPAHGIFPFRFYPLEKLRNINMGAFFRPTLKFKLCEAAEEIDREFLSH